MDSNQNNDTLQEKIYSDKNIQKRPSKSLVGLIISDLFGHQKLSLLLLVMIVISAGAVLITTQQVRKQLFEREQLLLEQDVLESEWRNLVIEENVLADPKRVEDKAKVQLGMSYVTPQNETVIVIKSKQ
ncbi:cell division protein FtsL [Gilliamella sp. Pra-s65]|uniref:cell division protein FtsL n=1 Tax=unclassified Gilliamella TaxID=2685620 RepID=UPI001324BB1B|nr:MULTISPECIES: cell division protein FtsL [unclassified Gilliamella]MWN31828.1 cell division protein FtsL [Gilliamella sp. Pra-s60]MWN89211.1 cell division protein FtsL [Gilliamella sp. Pra-s65]MWP28935.1 cell division protein FtsL [Gilliamella sp. Pra-s54]MWP45859.1 cell division protein FtsL [Gilliamella sp. Pas-s27]MWP72254.1 cell division protein FtsL [Gilliamella sp. Pra-s52]